MNITSAKQHVVNTVRAYLATDDDGLRLIDGPSQRPLFLVGPPGIGKTAIMAQVARELGIGLVAYSMTHHTRQSALGLPVIRHRDFKGREYDASEYTMSEIVAAVYDYMERTGVEQGILFLDEVNCVSETLYPSMLQFLQFKTFGTHAVPDGWVIVCAGNPPEYNRSVHEFDVVTLDRIRRIDVEPDVDAWRAYAADAGAHPAVTTFLETERDCFYRIESTPAGKRFVTARGWSDLSKMIALNERLGIPVDQDLIAQFVQDDDIAERFALYYDLFRKYRSDYQVPAILAGSAPESIVQRARDAQLDERLAVSGLLLDALSADAADLAVHEDAITSVRDALREAKPVVLQGGSVAETLGAAIDDGERVLRRSAESNVRDDAALRSQTRALDMLKACRAACASAGVEAGDAAFQTIHQEFRGFAGAFEASVSAYRDQMDNAFAFLEDAFGEGNEMLMFAAELTARRATVRFVSRYGCDAFSRHSQGLQLDEKRSDLLRRIDALQASRAGDASAGPVDGGAGGNAPSALASQAAGGRAPEAGEEELAAYYAGARWEFGYASLCHMALPGGLEGKTALDVGCRRGKGVFKLSDRVGACGRAIGVDWVPDHVNEATERMGRAARETGLPANNMEFHLAYPEDLLAAGLGGNTVDMAFVNSVLHLTYSPERALAEIHRVLKPGGLLVCEVALADGVRDASVVEAARSIGNSIQAAPGRDGFESLLDGLGFDVEVAESPHDVEPNMGFKRGHEAPTAPSDESVAFQAMVLHCTKRR